MHKMHSTLTIGDGNLISDYQTVKIKKERFITSLFSTPAEARTLDTLIKSQVLYQLSYGCIILF